MPDRRSWEYKTLLIKGDLAQLATVCVDGWRFREFVTVDVKNAPDGRNVHATFVVLLEREKSSIIGA